jgi:hypothetical protein
MKKSYKEGHDICVRVFFADAGWYVELKLENKRNKKQAWLSDSIKYMYDRSYKTRHIERLWLGSYIHSIVFVHYFFIVFYIYALRNQLDN